jgi:hypothetical protein
LIHVEAAIVRAVTCGAGVMQAFQQRLQDSKVLQTLHILGTNSRPAFLPRRWVLVTWHLCGILTTKRLESWAKCQNGITHEFSRHGAKSVPMSMRKWRAEQYWDTALSLWCQRFVNGSLAGDR